MDTSDCISKKMCKFAPCIFSLARERADANMSTPSYWLNRYSCDFFLPKS